MVKFWLVSNIALKNIHRGYSIKKAVPKNLATLIEKYLCWSLFLINLKAYKPTTSLQRDSNTRVFLWTLRYFCERPLLNFQSGRNNRKNRDASRDDNRRRIENPVKHQRWRFLQKQLPVFNCWLFLQSISY